MLPKIKPIVPINTRAMVDAFEDKLVSGGFMAKSYLRYKWVNGSRLA